MNTATPCPPPLPAIASCLWNGHPYRVTTAELGAYVDAHLPALLWDFDIHTERIDPDGIVLDEDDLPPDALHLRVRDCPAFSSGPGAVAHWNDIAGMQIRFASKDEPEVLLYTGEHLALDNGGFALSERDGQLWIALNGHCDGMHGPARIEVLAPLTFTTIACGRRDQAQAREHIATVVDPDHYAFECDEYGVARFRPIHTR